MSTEIIKIRTPEEKYGEFMNMPSSVVKNIKYYREIMGHSFIEANICKKDGCVYFSHTVFNVKKSKNGYYRQNKSRDGFTVDQKGKIKVWFGKNIFQIPCIGEVFNYLNCNWLDQKLYPYVTKTILEKIIAGKITNNIDVVKAYFKMMKINGSPSLFLKMINTNNVSKIELMRYMSVAKDVNHLFEYWIIRHSAETDYPKNQLFYDMVQEAHILDKKIDFNWSFNRLKEEHKAWTQEIMQYEIESLDDISVESLNKFDRYTPEGFKLLKTQREVFYEGKTMNHCVYTAYWNSIAKGNYLAYHVNINGEEATLGLHIYGDTISYNQCFSYYNKSISPELSTITMEFFNHLKEQVERDGVLKIEKHETVDHLEIPLNNQIPF